MFHASFFRFKVIVQQKAILKLTVVSVLQKADDPPPVRVLDIVNILRQVAEALKYLHESRDQSGNEVTHGDVAARNVLLTSTDLTKYKFQGLLIKRYNVLS